MRRLFARALAPCTLFVFVTAGLVHAADSEPAKSPKIKCGMSFTLAGWSALYKTAKGDGKITCDNGQSADVTLKVTGGGLTFGKSKTVDGSGTFSSVQSIDELFGSFAAAAAHAGAVKSSEAQALTKGDVSLALAGTGSGFDLGVDFSKFTIKKK